MRGSLRGERGAGTVVALGMVLGVVAALLLVLPVYAVLATRHSVVAAADAAALAAADGASGLEAGHPCELAGRVAGANGAAVTSCAVDGLVATVTVGRRVAGFWIEGSARAGPAGSAPD